MDSRKPLNKSIVFWIMVLFLLYSALGFFAVPYFIKKEITKIASEDLNSSIIFDKISFNPYRLTTNLKHIKLIDKDTQLWFSANNALINFSLIKTLFGNTHISEITLDNPHYHLLLAKKNNNTSLIYPQLKTLETDKSQALSLDIEHITINHGSVSYLDKSSNTIVNLKFKAVGFKHVDFTTDDKNSQFDLSLLTQEDDKITVTGQFNLPKLSASGQWKLEQFSTQTLFKLLSDSDNEFYGFHNESGFINAQGEFNYDSNTQTLPKLNIQHLQLTDFKTKDSQANQPNLLIPDLMISNADLDLDNKQLAVSSIVHNNSQLSASFTPENQFIWDELNTTNQIDTTDNQEKNWRIVINEIKGQQTTLKINKNKGEALFENILEITTTEINNLTNIEGQDTQLKLSIIPDGSGSIDLNTTLQLKPFTVSSEVSANAINLKSSQAWIPNDIKLFVENGTLSFQQNFILAEDEYHSSGWVKLNVLNLLDVNKQTFLKVTELELTDSEIDSATKTINLNTIKLDNAEGNLSISSDSKLNINTIISDQNDKQKIKNKIKNTKDDWIINIKQIELIDLQSTFIDRSISPSYQSSLTKVNGIIKDLSSTNTSKADVDLKGLLDTYGKFNIKGQINPLSEKAYTDLSINIENLSLQNFNSYSARYLGYPITRGKANFKLKYKLNQSLLKGLNDLEFKQLQFGAKNQSKDAVSLPLKLAVSLLTDGKGIMKINLPVSGNINDPEFSYGGLVFRAFFKLITGIVASPFKLLGKLIPGGADLDLSGIQFKAGTTELNAGEDAKLDAMQKIIQQRPDIIVELTGVTNTINDKKALQEQLLIKSLNLNSSPDLSNSEILKPLEKHFSKVFSNEKWQQLTTNASSDNGLNRQLLAENAWNDLLSMQNTDESLSLLAKQRAQAIQQLLVEEHSTSTDNIFLKPSEQSEELYPQVKFGVGH